MDLDVVVRSDNLLINHIVFRYLEAYLDLFLHILIVLLVVAGILLVDVLVEDVLAAVRDGIASE